MTVPRIAVLLTLAAAGCAKPAVERVEWTAMGTVAAVQTRGAASGEEVAKVVRTVKAEFARVEKLLNAHDPDSELSRLAPLPEEDILRRCDESVRPCYEMAFDLMRKSGGAFNPRWRGTNTLDLGAIAKGFAVDLAAESVGYPKDYDLLIDLGGNLRSVKGVWRTGVAGTDEVLPLGEGFALATSAEYYRGKHIYDGRTGKPVSNKVVSVTVESGRAMVADGLSTTLFVLGPEEGGRFFTGNRAVPIGSQVLWQMNDGRSVSLRARAPTSPTGGDIPVE